MGRVKEMSAANPAFANLPFKHPVEPLQCCFAAFGSSSDASAPSHATTVSSHVLACRPVSAMLPLLPSLLASAMRCDPVPVQLCA